MEDTKKKYSFFKMISSLLKNLIKENKTIILYFIIYTITASIYPFLGIYLQKSLISILTSEEVVADSILYTLGIYIILACVLGFVSEYVKQLNTPKLSRLRINLLADMCKKILEIDYKYSEDANFLNEHNLAFQACNSNYDGVELVYNELFYSLARIISIVIFAILVSYLSVWALLAVIFSVAMSFVVKSLVNILQYKKRSEFSKASRKVSYYEKTANNFEYGKDIRVYNLQDKVMSAYKKSAFNYLSVFRRFKNKEYKYGFLELFGTLVSDIAIYGILIYNVITNKIDLASFTMYLSASLALSTYLKEFATSISQIQYAGLYVSEFFNFMEKDLCSSTGTRKRLETKTFDIEFKNVSFKYPNSDKYIYQNLNLKIPAGQKLAIVGINGAGKTTLVKLMTRLFETSSGEILINNIPAKEFDLLEYQKMFSVVFQDVHILAMSIEENISFQKDNIDEDKVNDCLKQIGMYDKVNQYPNNIKQMMLKILDEEGVLLSGGEAQKIVIARALYKNGNCVILDEPTSALDALAEAEIYEEFNDLVKGKTAIYISHRLASTKFCDKIAMFSNDGLIEYGTHDELMDKKGEYYNMFVTQGKYYQEEGDNYES